MPSRVRKVCFISSWVLIEKDARSRPAEVIAKWHRDGVVRIRLTRLTLFHMQHHFVAFTDEYVRIHRGVQGVITYTSSAVVVRLLQREDVIE